MCLPNSSFYPNIQCTFLVRQFSRLKIPIQLLYQSLHTLVLFLLIRTALVHEENKHFYCLELMILLYYNQIYGSLIKTYVFFRLDKQSWTRQKTKLDKSGGALQQRLISLSSTGMHLFAMLVFISAIGLMTGVFTF